MKYGSDLTDSFFLGIFSHVVVLHIDNPNIFMKYISSFSCTDLYISRFILSTYITILLLAIVFTSKISSLISIYLIKPVNCLTCVNNNSRKYSNRRGLMDNIQQRIILRVLFKIMTKKSIDQDLSAS